MEKPFPITYRSEDNSEKTGKLLFSTLKLEYEEMFREIRSIHGIRIKIFSLVMSTIVAVVGYALAGAWIYLSKVGVEIPSIIVISYTLLGCLFAFTLHLILFSVFNYLGPSKKHLVRYWKSIHLLRAGIVRVAPETAEFFLFPISVEKNRPRVSTRWKYGVLIFPLINLLTFSLLVMFIAPSFALSHGSLDLVMAGTAPLAMTLIMVCPVPILLIAHGAPCMRDYLRNLEEVRDMTASTVFVRKALDKDESARRRLRKEQLGWLLGIFILCELWGGLALWGPLRIELFFAAIVVIIIWLVQVVFTYRYLHQSGLIGTGWKMFEHWVSDTI
jgi:hypothetical protein